MRRLLLILFWLCIFQTSHAQNLSVCVDERLELTGVVCRIARIDGFINDCCPTYMREIDSYFDKYNSHPLIDFIQGLNVARSEIVASAFTFDIENNQILPNEEKLTMFFHPGRGVYWSENTYRKYISLLNDFYCSSNFHQFFEILHDTYEKSQAQAHQMLSNIDFTWFSLNYPYNELDVKVCLGLSLGIHNFSITNKNLSLGDVLVVIGCDGESEGIPTFKYPTLTADVFEHEINHFYVRPIIDDIYDSIKQQMEFISNKVRKRGSLKSYLHSEVLASEWMTELFTALYKYDNEGDYSANYYIDRCMDKGFIWIHRSFICLKNYRCERRHHGTLNKFVPYLVDHLRSVAEDWELIIDEASHKNPYVVNVFPVNGSELDESQTEIHITFSRPMRKDVHGIGVNELYPMLPISRGEWIDDYTFCIQLYDIKSADSGTYGFMLPQYNFISSTCSPIQNDQNFYYKILK